MVRPIYKTYTPSDANLTGFASNVTGGVWTVGSTSIPDGLAHRISLKNNSATNHSAKTVTFIGTDQDGNAQSETINMPGASATVETSYYFKTLTSAAPSASIGVDTMGIGYVDEFSSQIIPLEVRGSLLYVGVDVSGTINYSVQYTRNDILGNDRPPYNWQQDDGTAVVDSNSSGSATFTSIPMAMRVIANSYSPQASLKLTISQMNPGS